LLDSLLQEKTMLEPLWGEIPNDRTKTGLSQAEREALCKIPQVPLLEGPKLYQPEPESAKIKQEVAVAPNDVLVTQTIELLRYRRQMTRVLEAVVQHKAAAGGDADQLPPIGQPPAIPAAGPFVRKAKSTLFGFPLKEEIDVKPTVIPSISKKDAEAGLRKAVIKLSAHVGYQTAQDSAVRILTESTELFLEKLTRRLRSELDRELERDGEGNGWTDILEKVLVETGTGGVLGVQDYYESSVIKYHARVLTQARAVRDKYRTEVPSENGAWQQTEDDIPEMHFPSSDEGAGLGESVPNHATPTLDVGMQMLQSLEASGDLDTPLSGDSEALSNMSCHTPSPALTPRTSTSSPQFSSAKKRRRSGGKFI